MQNKEDGFLLEVLTDAEEPPEQTKKSADMQGVVQLSWTDYLWQKKMVVSYFC